VSFKINNLPVATGIVLNNLPSVVKPNSTHSVNITGGTDVDSGQTLKYSISSDKSYVTFSKSTDIASGENFNITYSSAATRGETPTFTITVSDGLETSTKTITTLGKVNSLPDISGVTLTLPTVVKPNSINNVQLSGATDANGQTLSYSISCDKAYVSFSKSTGLTANENFSITYSTLAVRGETPTFTIAVSDGLETSTKTITTLGKVNTLPDISGVTLTLPTVVKPNSTNSVSISGATDANGQTLTYSISCNKAYVTFSKSTGLTSGESFNIIYSASAVRGETPTFTITVSDGLETSTKTITTLGKVNSLPDTSNVTLTLPPVVKPNSTNSVSISGATDANGQTLTYSISCDKSYVSFSKSTGLLANESFNIIYSSSAVRGETPTFTIAVNDGLETTTKTINTLGKVNSLPDTSNVTLTLPPVVKPNSTNSVSISGATDANGQTLTYDISCDKTYVTFSKSTGLTNGESFNIIYSASAVRGETPIFTIAVNDGLETTTKTITTLGKVNTLPDTSGITLTLPAVVKPNSINNVQLSGATDANGQTLSYSISCDKAYVSFSKSTGLTANENFSITYSSSAVRGETPTFTITVSDGLETSTKTITTLGKVNTLPDISGVTLTLPTVVKPNSTNSVSISGATDANGQALTYSIGCDKTYVSFSKSTGLAANENFSITYSSSAVRGETPTFTITVSDGLETSTKTINTLGKVNSLPDTSSITLTLPTVVKPNSTNSVQLSGATDANGQTLSYSISCNKAYVTFSKSTGLTSGENFDIIYSTSAVRGETPTFTITVSDGLETVTKTITTVGKVNTLPNTSSITLTLPVIVKPNSTNSVQLSGATDTDSQTLSYSISCNKAYVTFSKSTGLTSGENFDIIYSTSAVRGETPTFTITVSDGLETTTKTITTLGKVNSLPDASSITSSDLTTSVVGGTTYTFTLSGGTDADGHTLKYKITGGSGLNIAPTDNITAGSNITFTPTKVANATNITFQVYAIDSLNEQSSNSKSFTVTVNPLLRTATPSIISPSSNAEITLPYTFQVSPYDTYIEL
jgi:hypothetical protein